MSEENKIHAKCTLSQNADSVPEAGFNKRELRVDLAPEPGKHPTHLAVLNVQGDLPWRRGEEREVVVKIMSDEFYERVLSSLPKLFVCYGAKVLGTLDLTED